MSQTVRIEWQYILSRVRISVRPSIFYTRKHTKAIAKTESRARVLLDAPVTVDRSPATTWAATTAIIAAKDWAKTATTRVYTFTTWKNGLGLLLRIAYVFVKCIKINKYELFFYCFPVCKFILFYFGRGLDMVRIARVTCLVIINGASVRTAFLTSVDLQAFIRNEIVRCMQGYSRRLDLSVVYTWCSQ